MMSDRTVPAVGTSNDSATIDPRALLIALNQASYDWCLETDLLAWSAGAAHVLGIGDKATLASGKAFARLLDFDTPGGRHEAIIHGTPGKAGEGVAYCLRYAYRPDGNRRRRWIEDRGRWFAGPDGRPASASGLVRIVAECAEDEAGVTGHGSPGTVLGHALARAVETGRPAALFLVSINRLDGIHTTFGAVIADVVAAQVMRSLRKVLRIGDSLISIADGKFALVLSGCDAADLPQAAERFGHAVATLSIEAEGGTIRPTISIGGVRIAPDAEDPASALHAAQRALDRCEREKSEGFVVLSGPDEAGTAVVGAAQLLAAALNEDRLFLAFDPVLDVRNMGHLLFRARAFMRTPGCRAPWLAARLTPDCDRALARRFALRLIDLAGAVLARHPGIQLALPLPILVAPPAGPGDTISRLTIELDEAVARADLDQGGRYCRAIRITGARLGVTGFGGGHLSFEALKNLQADRVTLHGALVETADQVAQGRFALHSLIEAACQHQIAIGADWVDDEAIAHLLAGWGCDRLQGAVAGPLRLDLPRPRAVGRQQPLALTGT